MKENTTENIPKGNNLDPATEKTTGQSVWELVRFALIAILIVIPIRFFLAEPFIVSGSSMFPTFENADYLIVDKISYRLSNPERDDVIVFKNTKDHKTFLIKRIIGLPGETVDIKGSIVTITNDEHKDGFILTEPYIKEMQASSTHITLKGDEYFVMGDNRNASSDSRYWGPLQRTLITGRPLLRLLPLSNIDFKPGDYKQQVE